MKETRWISDNKMLFESEHKTFNKAVKVISRGNVISGTQCSCYIRSYYQTECNGYTFPKGRLREIDLEAWGKDFPLSIVNWIREYREAVYAYSFFYRKSGRRIYIGWVITTPQHDLLRAEYARHNRKTISALDECIKYVTR